MNKIINEVKNYKSFCINTQIIVKTWMCRNVSLKHTGYRILVQ